jgi:hypothetical protein
MEDDLRESITKRKEQIEEQGHAFDQAYSEDVEIKAADGAAYELDRLLRLDEMDRL